MAMAKLPSFHFTRTLLGSSSKRLASLKPLTYTRHPPYIYIYPATHFSPLPNHIQAISFSTSISTSTLSLEQMILDKTQGKSTENEGVVVEKTEGTLTCTGLYNAKLYQPITITSTSTSTSTSNSNENSNDVATEAQGVIISLEAKLARVALLNGQTRHIKLGSKATLDPLNLTLTIPTLAAVNGKVVNALGKPHTVLDPDGEIVGGSTLDVLTCTRRSMMAHGKIMSQMFTKIRVIDVLYPLGFGERIALVGSAGSGKRALARDVAGRAGVDQIVWISMGQSVAQVERTRQELSVAGVLEKTVIVHEGEGELWGRRWLAPMTGMRLAEDTDGAVLVVVEGFTEETSRVLGDVRKEVYSHWKQPQAEVFERCGNFSSSHASITCVAIFDTDDDPQSDRFKDLLNGIVDRVVECQVGLPGQKYAFEALSIGNVSAARHQHPALKKLCIRLRRIMYALNEELNAVELARAFGIDHTEERDIQHCIEHAEMLRAFFAMTQEEPFASTFVALVVAANGRLEGLADASFIDTLVSGVVEDSKGEAGLGLEESLYTRICAMESKAGLSETEVEEVEAMVLRLVDDALACRRTL